MCFKFPLKMCKSIHLSRRVFTHRWNGLLTWPKTVTGIKVIGTTIFAGFGRQIRCGGIISVSGATGAGTSIGNRCTCHCHTNRFEIRY